MNEILKLLSPELYWRVCLSLLYGIDKLTINFARSHLYAQRRLKTASAGLRPSLQANTSLDQRNEADEAVKAEGDTETPGTSQRIRYDQGHDVEMTAAQKAAQILSFGEAFIAASNAALREMQGLDPSKKREVTPSSILERLDFELSPDVRKFRPDMARITEGVKASKGALRAVQMIEMQKKEFDRDTERMIADAQEVAAVADAFVAAEAPTEDIDQHFETLNPMDQLRLLNRVHGKLLGLISQLSAGNSKIATLNPFADMALIGMVNGHLLDYAQRIVNENREAFDETFVSRGLTLPVVDEIDRLEDARIAGLQTQPAEAIKPEPQNSIADTRALVAAHRPAATAEANVDDLATEPDDIAVATKTKKAKKA